MMFKLSLPELGKSHEEVLATHDTGDLLELLLKQGRERTFLDWMTRHVKKIKKLLYHSYRKSGILYILGVEKKHSAEELRQKIVNTTKKGGLHDRSTAMTTTGYTTRQP
jgi:hypothetical protein